MTRPTAMVTVDDGAIDGGGAFENCGVGIVAVAAAAVGT